MMWKGKHIWDYEIETDVGDDYFRIQFDMDAGQKGSRFCETIDAGIDDMRVFLIETDDGECEREVDITDTMSSDLQKEIEQAAMNYAEESQPAAIMDYADVPFARNH